MLTHLRIRNYTVVDELAVDLGAGMTAITGETGAGKSIMLDALGLCLGDRADARAIRPGCSSADISACFNLEHIPAACAWLEERELLSEQECILRRVITRDRSRAFINGTPATVQQCAELGALLVDIHSQHAHQSLLRREVQRELLDGFGGAGKQAREVAALASEWQQTQRALEALRGRQDSAARRELLSYQVSELEELALGAGELESLEAEQSTLANADTLLSSAGEAQAACEGLEEQLRAVLKLLGSELHRGARVDNAREMLESAAIQCAEAATDLSAHLDALEVDPQRLAQVEQRLEQIYAVARKHRVLPEQLPEVQASLNSELEQLGNSDADAAALETRLLELGTRYRDAAAALGKRRRRAAKTLGQAVRELLGTLAMERCHFEVRLTPRAGAAPHPGGSEEVEFLVSTNPGAEPGPLQRIASGGELSRISLAIQVATTRTASIPSMVFDEVDVGIGGAVAEVVGRLLRQLGERAQVLCVTHLPQVAAQGNAHLSVRKGGDDKHVRTTLETLDEDGRVEELARMLGGIKVTAQTRAHAREMLSPGD